MASKEASPTVISEEKPANKRGRKVGQLSQKSLRRQKQAEGARGRFSKNRGKNVDITAVETDDVIEGSEKPVNKKAKLPKPLVEVTLPITPNTSPDGNEINSLSATVQLLIARISAIESDVALIRSEIDDNNTRFDSFAEKLAPILSSSSTHA